MKRKTWLLLACAAFIVALTIVPARGADAVGPAQPVQPAPSETPVPPPSPPPAPSAPAAVAPAPAAPAGQWSYTTQYGWVWMPYDQRYTYVDESAANAQMFVYTAPLGWHWVAAPWVVGIGPVPYWGAFGPAHFAWYAHPWFRVGPVRAGWVAHPARWHFAHGRR